MYSWLDITDYSTGFTGAPVPDTDTCMCTCTNTNKYKIYSLLLLEGVPQLYLLYNLDIPGIYV